jgi:hypothetical protein
MDEATRRSAAPLAAGYDEESSMQVDPGGITICIPTMNRPALLAEAIKSCFLQHYRPLEILIGDNSGHDDSEKMVALITPPNGVRIRYERDAVPRGQSNNVNWLFDSAAAPRLVLLHDDDLLLPHALDAMNDEWLRNSEAVCVFGKQLVVDAGGQVDPEETIALNTMYQRTQKESGPQRSSMEVGLLQRIPNNGFLIQTELARAVRYRTEAEVGHAVDADFGIRLGAAAPCGSIVFINAFVSAYRLTSASIMRSDAIRQGHHLFYEAVLSMSLSPEDKAPQTALLRRIAPGALLDAANVGRRGLAWSILTSKFYAPSALSLHTLAAMLSLVSPRLGELSRPMMKRVRRMTRKVRVGPMQASAPGGPEPEMSEIRQAAEDLSKCLATRLVQVS